MGSCLSQLFRSRMIAFGMMLLWMGVIFAFSTLTGKETVGPPPLWYFLERKGAHVVEYALLMLFSFRYFRLCYGRESFKRVLVLAAGFALMYGATDELHQYFVPGRGARLTDVLIDGLGILLMSPLLSLWHKNKNRP